VPRKPNVRPDEPGRERVLAAALELFGERGYHATSIAEIGERAGIAKSVLYHYFGSKAGLYEALAEAETQGLVARVAAAVPADPLAPRLRAGVDAYLGYLAERPHAWRLLLRDPPADPALVTVYERLAAERETALAACLASPGKRAEAGPHIQLVATAIRTFADWWYEHREVPQEEISDAILDVARAGALRLRSIRPAAG
jgi:AcrR family transcriptional regulator